ncbi:DUF2971 domain-containing protein [Methylosinus sp. H3A]|uniref:DUF2971 domain-containing protein n=1 Tax=Methylosinus sp. H3A TaxID=2785786 RepID=UPI0018C21859|nr:DUF2971 domain-containing protein [Methylosinus sp. H3A]MBG0812205.1 DUF2971 domain-containing protein [Methylosinus sp. H3A]
MSNYDFEGWTADEITRIQTGTNLKRPSDHQSMFKYVSLNSDISWDYLYKTLHNLELVGSSALSLNDPFELSPNTFDDLQPNTIAAAVRHNDIMERFSGKQPMPLQDVFSDCEPYRQQALSFLNSVATQYRIISFCERADSGLLWAHYANSYQGACLQFLAKGFRWKRNHTLGYVGYTKYRPTYPLSLALSLSSKLGGPRIPVNATPLKRAESEKILFFVKSEEWAYESEIRVVYDDEITKSVAFHKDSLISIITGPKFSDENRRRLSDLMKGSPCENIAIRSAKLSKTTFSIEVDS